MTTNRGVLDVGKKRAEAVKLLGGDRIELVVVTLGTTEGQAQPDTGGVAHSVSGVLGRVFLGLGPAFLRCLEQAIVAGGDPLLRAGGGDQIAGKLLEGEAIRRA